MDDLLNYNRRHGKQVDMDQPATKHDLIMAVWEGLDCASVGARELKQIQRAVGQRFGAGAVDSPAALARMLADEGALLRHPEILECDARWRARRLSEPAAIQLSFGSLSEAAQSMVELERLRRELSKSGDARVLRELRDAIGQHRGACLLIVESPVLTQAERAEASEIVSWFDVWLRTPELFTDWLELRRAAPEFRERFE